MMMKQKPLTTSSVVHYSEIFPPHVVAWTSYRDQDFAYPAGQCVLTPSQRKYILEQAGNCLEAVVSIKQVHGDRIVCAKGAARDDIFEGEADGAVTDQPGIALTVRTADCLPIFLYDPFRRAIGLVHAGWKGTRSEIILRATEKIKEFFGVNPSDLRVAFGPCIQAQSYDVGPEFKTMFPDEVVERDGKLYFDLPRANRRQLLTAGIRAENIYDCGICTYESKGCFSYRREKEQAGRMISVMMLKKTSDATG